jgi:uncharacterized protein YjgD (DUF1641 family)
MAVAVDFRHFQPVDAREDLARRVREAPAEHAEAILAAYDLLQQLHDNDVFSLLSGLLGASDTVVSQVVNLVSSKEMITVLRILLIFGNVLKSVDPNKLSALLADTANQDASLLSIGKQAASKDARRAMATAVGLLNILGDALEKQNPSHKS